MQQFVVPQFIDVEDKVIGPITVRQFVILLVAGLLLFVAYRLSDLALFIVWLLVLGGSALILAFAKVNGRPIHYFFLNFLQTSRRARLRIWNKQQKSFEQRNAKQQRDELPPRVALKPRVGSSRLAELSLVVDTGGMYQGEPFSTNKS